MSTPNQREIGFDGGPYSPCDKMSASSSDDMGCPPNAGSYDRAMSMVSADDDGRMSAASSSEGTHSEHGSTHTDVAEDAASAIYGEDEDKAARSRERNREHARRTRMRKKAHLQGLQHRVGELKQEAERLDVALGEVTTANILLDISHKRKQASSPALDVEDTGVESSPATSDEDSGSMDGTRLASKKMRRLASSDSEEPLGGGGDGGGGGGSAASGSSGPVSDGSVLGDEGLQVNLKDGYAIDAEGRRRPLTGEELEKLRRERNRMHAKMTRDRKKRLIADLEQSISELEAKNRTRRMALGTNLARNLSHNSLNKFGAQYGVTGDDAIAINQ